MTDADLPVPPQASPAPRRVSRFIVPTLAILAVAAILVFALRPGIDAAAKLLPLFRGLTIVWALAAIACQGIMYLCIAGGLRAGLGAAKDDALTPIPPVTLAGVSAAFLWANRALPGPAVAGLATLVFLLGRRGVPAANAQTAAATFYVADYVAFAPLSVIVIVLLSQFSRLGGLHSGAMFIALGLVGAGMIAALVVLKSPRAAERLAGQAARFASILLRRTDRDSLSVKFRLAVSHFYERWNELTTKPGPLIAGSIWSLLAHLADTATILCSALAFAKTGSAQHASVAGVIGIYCLAAGTAFVSGNLAAIVSFLPAGIGFFEGAMVTSLHLVGGLTIAEAALATVLYRTLSVWLPLPFVLRTARHAVVSMSSASRKGVSE